MKHQPRVIIAPNEGRDKKLLLLTLSKNKQWHSLFRRFSSWVFIPNTATYLSLSLSFSRAFAGTLPTAVAAVASD
jgi:hypothetical protein